MSSQAAVVYSESNRVVASEGQIKEALEQGVNWSKYDGERVKGSNSDPIYLVLNGQLSWIPDSTTYNNLFANWNNVVVSDYLVDNIPRGPALSVGAVLAKGAASAPVYLITNGKKQWIPDPAVLAKFNFNGGKVVATPQVIIDAIPSGANVG